MLAMSNDTGELPADAASYVDVDAPVEPDGNPEVRQPESAPVVKNPDDNFQKRIDKLTREKRELERRLTALETRPEPQKEQPKKPTLEGSSFDETAYQEALNKYNDQLLDQKAEEAAKRILEKRDADTKARSIDASFAERFGRLSSEERETAESAYVTEHAANLIKELDNGEKVALFLGANRELAEKIAGMSTSMQAYELGKIAARLDSSSTPQKPVSNAPPPAARLEASNASPYISPLSADSDKLSDEEWFKAERKRLASKQR